MNAYLIVAVGGAIGSVGRFALAGLIDGRWAGEFPLGTLVVNVLGSFLIGLIAGLTDHKPTQQFLMTGILGGFTTFSSFSLQTVRLVEDGRLLPAGGYVLASVALCLLGTFLGLLVARAVSRGAQP